jgi:signal transduction histidine kinase
MNIIANRSHTGQKEFAEIDGHPGILHGDNLQTADVKQQVSCRVTNSILKYLESNGYDTDSIVNELPYSKEYLCDPFNWVEYEIRETITRRAAELTGNEAVMYEIGLSTPKFKPLGGLEPLIKVLAGPKTAYRFVPKYASLFDKIFKFNITFIGDYQAIATMSIDGDYPTSKASCYYAQGILAAIPTLWNLPPAEIHEKECKCTPDGDDSKSGVRYGSHDCVWEIRWQPFKALHRRLLDKMHFREYWFSHKVDDLERNFRLVDKKNSELRARNIQLAKIRELALAIDGIKTKSQVFETVVESARDIPGVRFVLLLNWLDDEKKYVVAPYFSKVRNKYIDSALKATGFNIDEVFGEQSDSKHFKYLSSRSKLQETYLLNPQTLNISSLATVLEGIWPKVLCDSIQRIAGIKMTTIVPINIDKVIWGSMVFFLKDDVSTDLLEMVGAHCSSALKNANNIETLERRNKELNDQKEFIDRIITSTPNSVLVVGEDSIIKLANQAFYDIIKKSSNEVVGKSIHEIMPSEDLMQTIATAKSGNESHFKCEFKYKIDNRETIFVANIIQMQKGEIQLILNDVTVEREKQDRLYLTDRLASVGEMASGVAHELNNPLTGIVGLSQILAKQDVPEDIKQDLQAIHSEARRAAAIVKNLLTFARKHKPTHEPIRISQLLDDVLKLRDYEFKQKNISVKVCLPENLPEVTGDYFQIQQVFLNIILNAEFAMVDAHNQGTLTISAGEMGSRIKISFSDDGPGISSENMRHLFNPFFTTKEVGKGTGLGLSICYGIVTSHGGKIYALNENGQGATFVVELPAHNR